MQSCLLAVVIYVFALVLRNTMLVML